MLEQGSNSQRLFELVVVGVGPPGSQLPADVDGLAAGGQRVLAPPHLPEPVRQVGQRWPGPPEGVRAGPASLPSQQRMRNGGGACSSASTSGARRSAADTPASKQVVSSEARPPSSSGSPRAVRGGRAKPEVRLGHRAAAHRPGRVDTGRGVEETTSRRRRVLDRACAGVRAPDPAVTVPIIGPRTMDQLDSGSARTRWACPATSSTASTRWFLPARPSARYDLQRGRCRLAVAGAVGPSRRRRR